MSRKILINRSKPQPNRNLPNPDLALLSLKKNQSAFLSVLLVIERS
jgi:hypothetical protein